MEFYTEYCDCHNCYNNAICKKINVPVTLSKEINKLISTDDTLPLVINMRCKHFKELDDDN